MKDPFKTKAEMIEEISVLKKKIQELEQSESALKQMEESLRKSEAKYRQLFDNAPSAIYQVDFRTGRFLKANDVFCKYLGYSQEEITKLYSYDILTYESKKYCRNA